MLSYKKILRDQISGNGLAMLYSEGCCFYSGDISREEFIAYLRKQQDYFRGVINHTLTGQMSQKGPILEEGGIGHPQFQALLGILNEGEWGTDFSSIERFIQEVYNQRGKKRTDIITGDEYEIPEYERPEWMKKLLS